MLLHHLAAWLLSVGLAIFLCVDPLTTVGLHLQVPLAATGGPQGLVLWSTAPVSTFVELTWRGPKQRTTWSVGLDEYFLGPTWAYFFDAFIGLSDARRSCRTRGGGRGLRHGWRPSVARGGVASSIQVGRMSLGYLTLATKVKSADTALQDSSGTQNIGPT